jgi:hypothetical protein
MDWLVSRIPPPNNSGAGLFASLGSHWGAATFAPLLRLSAPQTSRAVRRRSVQQMTFDIIINPVLTGATDAGA